MISLCVGEETEASLQAKRVTGKASRGPSVSG